MMIKKAICIALCVVLALCFSSCKADKKGESETETNETQSETVSENNVSTTAAKAEKKAEIIPEIGEDVTITVIKNVEKFELGKIKNNNYYNKSAGFKIVGLDNAWSQSTPEQIAMIYDSGVDPDTGKAYASNSEDGSQNYIYDVMYNNKVTDEVISVSLLEYSGDGEGLDEEIPMSDASNEIEGFNDSAQLIYLNFAGKKAACKKIRYVKQNNIAKIPDLTEYEIYMMSASYRQVLKIVVVCFDGQPDIDDILEHIKPIND